MKGLLSTGPTSTSFEYKQRKTHDKTVIFVANFPELWSLSFLTLVLLLKLNFPVLFIFTLYYFGGTICLIVKVFIMQNLPPTVGQQAQIKDFQNKQKNLFLKKIIYL